VNTLIDSHCSNLTQTRRFDREVAEKLEAKRDAKWELDVGQWVEGMESDGIWHGSTLV
jgi:hypothetical protein